MNVDGLSASSLRPWLNLARSSSPYSGRYEIAGSTNSLLQLQPCVSATGNIVNCSQICDIGGADDDDNAIFDPTKTANLINCGLWRTATTSLALGNTHQYLWLQDQNVDMLRSVGLDFPPANLSIPSSSIYGDWSLCFGYLWSLVHPNQPTHFNVRGPSDGTIVATPCEPELIFGDASWSIFFPACIAQVCDASGWLNPDVGGIGVSISFVVQTCLAIIVFILLFATETLPQSKNSRHGEATKRTKFKDQLVTANAEFYKTQCYFASAIQIACLTLAAQMDSNALVEYGFFFGLATSGYVPVVFNLLCITRYGRSSWYFVNLAICCFMLSTATLCFSHWYWQGQQSMLFEGVFNDIASTDRVQFESELGLDQIHATEQCGAASVVKLLESWCGASVQIAISIQSSTILSGWNWVLWAICLIWLLYCVIAKCLEMSTDDPSQRIKQGRMHRVATRVRNGAFLPSPFITKHLARVFFAISWPIALGYQLYVYSLFFSTGQINTQWSFGQIVAVTIWASCFAEYILVFKEGVAQAHRFRLPKGYYILKRRNASSLLPPPASQISAQDSYQELTARNSTDQLSRSSADRRSSPANDVENVHEATSMF